MYSNTKTSTSAYRPPNRRRHPASAQERGIRWGGSRTSSKPAPPTLTARSFPALQGAGVAAGPPAHGTPTLAGFLAAAERKQARRRPKKAKGGLPPGWVKLPQPAEPPAGLGQPHIPRRQPSTDEWACAAARHLAHIQAQRDTEINTIGVHSKWFDATRVTEPLTHEEEPDLLRWEDGDGPEEGTPSDTDSDSY